MEKPLTIVWQCALGVEEYIAAGKSMEYSPAPQTALIPGSGLARNTWITATKSGVGSNTKLRRASAKGSQLP